MTKWNLFFNIIKNKCFKRKYITGVQAMTVAASRSEKSRSRKEEQGIEWQLIVHIALHSDASILWNSLIDLFADDSHENSWLVELIDLLKFQMKTNQI